MTDISLHELNGTNQFETLSNDFSKKLLTVTTQLRSVDKKIDNIERNGNFEDNQYENIQDDLNKIDQSIEFLNDDIKKLESMINYKDNSYYDGYKDNNDEYEINENDKMKYMIIEKLKKGVDETKRLLQQIQSSVTHLKTNTTGTDINNDIFNDNYNDNTDINDDGNNNTSTGTIGGKMYQIQHTPLNAEQIESQHFEAIQREAEINKIVNSVGELNQIFHDMDTIVNSQGELIDNIENNIYSTLENTRYADRELRKADNWDRKRRKFSCVLIVIVIIIMFILLALIS